MGVRPHPSLPPQGGKAGDSGFGTLVHKGLRARYPRMSLSMVRARIAVAAEAKVIAAMRMLV